MTHEIEGNNCFYLSKPAWHNLGTVLSNAPTPEEAWRLAYPYNLIEEPLIPLSGDESDVIPDKKAIYRDNGQYIATVGVNYGLVQPYEAFNFFKPYLASGDAVLESGGSLFDGKRLWALAKVKGAEASVTNGDSINLYLLVYTSFDGSLHHGIATTPVRVVCNNTLTLAINTSDKQHQVKIRHTKAIHTKIEQVQRQIGIIKGQFDFSVQAYKSLADKELNSNKLEEYLIKLFVPPTQDKPSPKLDDASPQMQAKVTRVLDLIDMQRDLVPAKNLTAWHAYNGVTQYLTHEQGRTEDTRLNSQWFGPSASLNQRALDLAIAIN